MNVAPPIVCAIAVAVMLIARWRGHLLVAALGKLLASSSFVWAALAWGALDSRYGLILLIGLGASWLGDALLVPRGTSGWFRLGIAAFLFAHLAYLAAFAQLPLDGTTLAGACVLAAVAALLIARWLWPHLDSAMRLPVILYIVTIMAMAAVACAASAGGATVLIALGAVTFTMSDLAVARDRFVAPGLVNKLWGQPLYFAAQLMLAASVWLRAAGTI